MNDTMPIIGKLFLALQNVRFYPPTHLLVRESIAEAHNLLQAALTREREFAFGFTESNLMVNGQPVNSDPSQTKTLSRQFELLHIGTVVFRSGLPLSELNSFLACLALKPENINESGGFAKVLADSDLKYIRVDAVQYGRITKEEKKVVKEKKTAGEDDYLKALRKASRSIPASDTAFMSMPTAATLPADVASLPSPDELKELYAIRDRFRAELDRKIGDATRRYEIENKRLAAEKDTMDSIVRNVGEGVVVIGNDGNILMANPAAEKMLGQQGRSVAGRKLKESLRDEHSLVMTGGGSDSVTEIEVAGKNEETRRVLRSSNAVIEDQNGRTIGVVSVLSDITKMREVEQMKSDFVANVSHELRSPLAAIQKNLAIILDQTAGAINDDQKEFLSLAKGSVERLTRLINDLLDLSKIEAGKMEPKKARTDLNRLLHDAVASFTGWFREKDIVARLDLPSVSLEMEVDADKITQVVNNLLSNALKFTPPKGEIRVNLAVTERSAEVSVSDTGVGIAPKDIQRIFDKFEQVTANHTVGVNGTGLGLALARQIVEMHGGALNVRSEIGKGSTFFFTLPR